MRNRHRADAPRVAAELRSSELRLRSLLRDAGSPRASGRLAWHDACMADDPDFLRRMRDQQEWIRRLTEGPDFLRQMRETQESIRRLTEGPEFLRQMRETQESIRRLTEGPEFLRQMRETQESIRRLTEGPEFLRQMREAEESIRRLTEEPDFQRRLQQSMDELRSPTGLAQLAIELQSVESAVETGVDSSLGQEAEADEALSELRTALTYWNADAGDVSAVAVGVRVRRGVRMDRCPAARRPIETVALDARCPERAPSLCGFSQPSLRPDGCRPCRRASHSAEPCATRALG